MTRKEQKEERKKAILMTALRIFVEKGYFDTKVSDIAEAVPMSTGLLFHYFESKEELFTELVKMGAYSTTSTEKLEDIPPQMYFTGLLSQMFSYAKEQPWVFQMFVLMSQARRPGMPEEARNIALSVNTIEQSAKIIKKGQKEGVFKKGDPVLLSTVFWASVQGIMEEMAMNSELKTPDPEWVVGILYNTK